MSPGLLDHLFVLVVLVLVFPVVGWWAYRRFLARLAREGGRALVREYRHTILWLIGLGAATLAVWLAGGRSLAALGLAPPLRGPASTLSFGIGQLGLDLEQVADQAESSRRPGRSGPLQTSPRPC
jgi:hypothetical protein